MSVVKEYLVNEGVLVLYDTIEALYYTFHNTFPQDIEEKVQELLLLLLNNLGEDEEFKEIDILKEEFISRTTYDMEEK